MMNDIRGKYLHILHEWYDFEIPELVERDFPEEYLSSDLIITISGVRRSGKTYLLYQISKALKKRVPDKNIVLVSLEDDRLFPLTKKDLPELIKVYRQNFEPEPAHKTYFLLDEIQYLPEWEMVLRRLYDKEKNIKFIITGSTSRLTPSDIATSLRGRTLSFKTFPFSFKEFLKMKGISVTPKDIEFRKIIDEIVRLLKEYMEYGGFPQVIKEKAKIELLREYYHSIMYRDIIERYSIRNIMLFENFLKLLVQSMASPISFGKMADFFKSIGVRVSKNTLIEYFKYAKDAFFAFDIPIFSYKIKDQIQYPRKLYLIDTGLKNALSFRHSEDRGRLAENIVFLELLRRNKEVYYWKDSSGYEVDFIIRENFSVKEAIQVCWNISEHKTYNREIRALLRALKEFNLRSGYIITEDLKEDKEIEGFTIKVRPLWYWLLTEEA